MANIVVCAPLEGGQPIAAALCAVGDGRRVSSVMGATVQALVATGPGGGPNEDQLCAALGAAGADKVLLVADPADLATAAAWQAPLALVIDRFAPRLFLLPAGPLAAELGPWLAAQVKGFLLPHARLDIRAGNEAVPPSVALRPDDKGDGPKDVDLAAAALPVVAIVDPHQAPVLTGTRPAELAVLDRGPA